MPAIKSLEDLKRVREEALQKRQLKSEPGGVQIIVGMGTPGIAAGARETMKAILETIAEKQLTNIVVRQTGNIGLDSWEPIVQVIIGEEPKVTYGRVNPDAARRIMQEHVQDGKIVKDYVIEA
ncbi:MAG: (2Fe-2S) ferredoxin domain-containing protein [Anaerolineales bacterium]|jgi:NADP-reducing hydrogenase subunit HndB|nr:(2Fe-2S) ferredoxin domain-containing protein [Anaerolineales bacterium]